MLKRLVVATLLTPSAALAQTADALAGKYGLAAYFDAKNAARTEASARAQCGAPYVIARGPNGGVMLHLPDDPKTSEMQVKTSFGAAYVGPAGEAGGKKDRKIVAFDERRLVLEWVDASVGGRYGTMVFVRCGK